MKTYTLKETGASYPENSLALDLPGFCPRNADSFRADLHPDLKADFILANPPFNMSDWGGENLRQDVRWKFGMPPVNNANYAWIQHFIHHLSPVGDLKPLSIKRKTFA
jgi:hypothetical protein